MSGAGNYVAGAGSSRLCRGIRARRRGPRAVRLGGQFVCLGGGRKGVFLEEAMGSASGIGLRRWAMLGGRLRGRRRGAVRGLRGASRRVKLGGLESWIMSVETCLSLMPLQGGFLSGVCFFSFFLFSPCPSVLTRMYLRYIWRSLWPPPPFQASRATGTGAISDIPARADGSRPFCSIAGEIV